MDAWRSGAQTLRVREGDDGVQTAMLGMFSARDDDMMALYGSPDAVQAMQTAREAAVDHHEALAGCKRLFENVAAGDLSNAGAAAAAMGGGLRL